MCSCMSYVEMRNAVGTLSKRGRVVLPPEGPPFVAQQAGMHGGIIPKREPCLAGARFSRDERIWTLAFPSRQRIHILDVSSDFLISLDMLHSEVM